MTAQAGTTRNNVHSGFVVPTWEYVMAEQAHICEQVKDQLRQEFLERSFELECCVRKGFKDVHRHLEAVIRHLSEVKAKLKGPEAVLQCAEAVSVLKGSLDHIRNSMDKLVLERMRAKGGPSSLEEACRRPHKAALASSTSTSSTAPAPVPAILAEAVAGPTATAIRQGEGAGGDVQARRNLGAAFAAEAVPSDPVKPLRRDASILAPGLRSDAAKALPDVGRCGESSECIEPPSACPEVEHCISRPGPHDGDFAGGAVAAPSASVAVRAAVAPAPSQAATNANAACATEDDSEATRVTRLAAIAASESEEICADSSEEQRLEVLGADVPERTPWMGLLHLSAELTRFGDALQFSRLAALAAECSDAEQELPPSSS